MKYKCYDISLDVDGWFNSDIYTATWEKEMIISVPDDYNTESQVEEYLREYIIESNEIEVDTPDWVEVYATDADFLYECIENCKSFQDDPDVDLYVEQSQMERS